MLIVYGIESFTNIAFKSALVSGFKAGLFLNLLLIRVFL
jgi:hypothetical protein